jgi:chromosome segregation ATPase
MNDYYYQILIAALGAVSWWFFKEQYSSMKSDIESVKTEIENSKKDAKKNLDDIENHADQLKQLVGAAQLNNINFQQSLNKDYTAIHKDILKARGKVAEISSMCENSSRELKSMVEEHNKRKAFTLTLLKAVRRLQLSEKRIKTEIVKLGKEVSLLRDKKAK